MDLHKYYKSSRQPLIILAVINTPVVKRGIYDPKVNIASSVVIFFLVARQSHDFI